MKKMKALSLAFLSLCIAGIATAQTSSGGWTSLFDGKTLNGWKKMVGTADYKVDNGMIVGTTVAGSPNSFIVTEKEYGDFILEAEIKVEDTTSNSGLQFRSHYDAQG